MTIIHPSPRHRPPITSPTLFNIIKHRRGRERVPPKPKENQPCFRASPPKIRASPPGIPSESPSESPLSMWCGVVAAASTSAAFFWRNSTKLPHSLGQPVPKGLTKCAEPVRHTHAQTAHVVILIDPARSLLQAQLQLARRLLPRPDGACPLLQSPQPSAACWQFRNAAWSRA